MPRSMALAILALLVLVASTPAAAQTPPLVEVQVQEPFAPVAPLQGNLALNVTVRVSCAALTSPAGRPFAYTVTEAPAWTTTVVSPASDVFPAGACEGGTATRTAVLLITASDQAPAFTPARITVQAKTQDAPELAGQGGTNVTASFFSILDVQTQEPIREAPPDTDLEITLRITNFGNDETEVRVTALDVSGRLSAIAPPPLVLGSKQQGAADIAGDAIVKVRTPSREGLVINEVGVVNLQITGRSVSQPSAQGDVSTVSLIITTKEGPGSVSETPAPSAVVAFVLAGLLIAWRRRAA